MILHWISILLVGILPTFSWAAFSAATGTCSNNSKTSNSSLSCTVATADYTAGSITALCWAGDNTATSDGNDQLLTGVSDSAGNPWTLPRCFTNSQGSAAAGATVCVSFGTMNRALTSGSGTITTTYSTITAKGFTTKNFTVGSGNGISLVGTPAEEAKDNTDPGSLDVTSANSAHLWWRCVASERPAGGTWTVTTNFTTGGCAGTSGGTQTNMEACAEYRIFTGTTNASDPTAQAVDSASEYFTIDEATPIRHQNIQITTP